MMQVALTVETFTKGLKYYLNDNAFKSVAPDDLYNSLQRAVDEDFKSTLNVKKIMSSWEHQSGFPLVTVSRSASNVVTLTQERFLLPNDVNSLWWIPINYVVGNNPNFTSTTSDLWMEGDKAVTIDGDTAIKPFTIKDWIIFNIQETSYYRVNYDDNLWKLIIKQLNTANGFKEIHVVNRAQLIDDSFSLADADIMDYSIPFSLLQYLINETDYIPWAVASHNILLINSKLTGTRIYSQYQQFVQTIVTTLYNKLGVNVITNEPKLDRYARVIAINLACKAGMTKCLNDTAVQLQNIIATNATLDPDVTQSIYCNGLRTNNDNAFMYLLSKMQQSDDETERELIINALGCSKNPTLLTMYLYSAIAPGNTYRLEEQSLVLKSVVSQGQLGLELTMNFIANHYELIPNLIKRILRSAATCVTTEDQLNVLDKLTMMLLSKGVVAQNAVTVNRALAQTNLNWILKNLEDVEEHLLTRSTTESIASTSVLESTTAGVESTTITSLILIISLIVNLC